MTWTDEKAERLLALREKQLQGTQTIAERFELSLLRAEAQDAFMTMLIARAEAGWPASTPAPPQDLHAISRAWRWSDHLMAGPERVWACWNGPIGNPDEKGSVWVLPLIEGRPPPTSADLATADFEDIANLYMTEQQCRAANERKDLDLR